MLHRIDDSVKSWQRMGLRRRLVFALLGVLVALSYALLLAGEEAQAKGEQQSPSGESAEGAIEGSAKPIREAAGEANKLASNEEAGVKEVVGKESGAAANDPTPRANKPGVTGDGPARETDKPATIDQAADKVTTAVEPSPKTSPPVPHEAPAAVGQVPDKNGPPVAERPESPGEVVETARDAIGPAAKPVLDEKISTAGTAFEEANKPPVTEPILDGATTRLPKAESIFEGASSAVEPVPEETDKPKIEPSLDEATSGIEPVLQKATATSRPILEETPSTVESLLDTANSKTEPVPERATAPVGPVLEETAKPEIAPVLNRVTPEIRPVLERAAAPASPVLEEMPSTVEPVLTETPPAVEPALDGAIPAAVEPVVEPVGRVSRPLGEQATPTAGPVLEEAALPGVEPAGGAATPVFEPVFETVAPVVGSGSEERVVVRPSAGTPALGGNTGAIPAPLSALPSHALAIEAQGARSEPWSASATLGSARDYGPVRDEPPVSAVGSPEARSRLFDGSFAVDGRHAVLPGGITAEDVREGTPHPLPFELPPAAPPVGISSGSSGAGMTLGLLAILASLPILSRVGRLSWSDRAAFKLGPSPQLAVERPG